MTSTQVLAAGSVAIPVEQMLSGLNPLTTYHFRTVAKNIYGTRRGTNITFTTAGAPPVAGTETPANITTNSATLRGSVNPNGSATTCYFEWGTTTNYGNATTQVLAVGTSVVPMQASLSSLVTDTPYHYRLVASNAYGVRCGNDVIVTPTLLLYLYAGESWTYTFHDLPPIGERASTGSSQEKGTFSILSNSFSADGSVLFEMFRNSTNEAPFGSLLMNSPATGGIIYTGTLVGWWSDRQGAVRLTMLSGSAVINELQFLHVAAQFPVAPAYENTIVPTRNPQPPSLRAQFVSSVSFGSAVLSADLNVNNLPTSVFVQWGSTTNYGSATGAATLDRDYFVTQQITVSNLPLNTLSHLRLVASNSAGLTVGSDLVVTTPPPITALTLAASNRRQTSATLNAEIAAHGFNTTAYFEWGSSTNYDRATPLQPLGNPTNPMPISTMLTGLTAQSSYHCRAVAFALGVTNFGNDVSFSTTFTPTNPVVLTNLVVDDVRSAIENGGAIVFACDGVVPLTNEIQVVTSVSIDATGRAISFDGGGITRIFRVAPGAVLTITNITLAHGKSTNGGAVYNEGRFTAYDCRLLSNAVSGAAGMAGTNGLHGTNSSDSQLTTPGTMGGPGGNGQDAVGGGLYNLGEASVVRCLFDHNSALAGNGGNGGTGGDGGYHPPCCSQAGGKDGGAGGNGGRGGSSRGGSIASFGVLLVDSCSFSNALVTSGSGAPGGSGGRDGGFLTHAGNGGAGGEGGAALGGAIYSIGSASISNSIFVGNLELGGAGGTGGTVPPSLAGSNGGAGGNGGSAGGTVFSTINCVIVNSTFVSNRVMGGNGALGEMFGGNPFGCSASSGAGGSAYGAGLLNVSTCSVINATFHNNTAISGVSPNRGPGEIHCTSSTNGFDGINAGGSVANFGGVLQIVNSIVSGGASNNFYGIMTDLGHNLSSDATPAWSSGTSVNNVDPLLLPLANNGGPTPTMALRAGSPALNAADCALAPATDLRGYPRPSGLGCDIGAYEGPGVPKLQVLRESNSTNVLRWLAEGGRTYRIERTASLLDWIPMSTNIPASNGWFELRVPVTNSTAFFRIEAK